MFIHVDYAPCEECNNTDTYGMMCVKCGKCGRSFENGIMVDDGGTHKMEEK